jgi:virginiamycin A acetyltransferase
MLLPGADLGNGVIVGAGAVVSGRVPDYAIVAGNPAKIIRRRFSEDTIQRLVTLAWWDWPIETILAAEAEICGGDIDALEKRRP